MSKREREPLPPPPEPITLEVISGWECQECEHISESCQEGVRLYECPECGMKFTNEQGRGKNGNMCPDCGNKFGTKIGENVCEQCGEGVCEQVDVVSCMCPDCDKDYHKVDDIRQ